MNGATKEEIEFLLRQRVELNALTSDQLIAWIERNLAEHGVRKIIPAKETLDQQYRARIRGLEIERVIAKVEADAGKIKVPRNLAKRVAAFLKKHPYASWDSAVAAIAKLEGEP